MARIESEISPISAGQATALFVSDSRPSSPSELTAHAIMEAFQALSDELAKRGIKGELCIFGGTVMVLAFKTRPATKDVDAVFHPTDIIRALAQEIAEQKGFPKNWLNDGVKGFIAQAPILTQAGLPQFENLRVSMPIPEYLLAMKCMAGRASEESSDLQDIVFLIGRLGLKSADQVLDIVEKYYGKSGIPIRTKYLVEGLFEEGRV
jgi:hypothetical protein